jgi:hypothetical protein
MFGRPKPDDGPSAKELTADLTLLLAKASSVVDRLTEKLDQTEPSERGGTHE